MSGKDRRHDHVRQDTGKKERPQAMKEDVIDMMLLIKEKRNDRGGETGIRNVVHFDFIQYGCFH